MATHRIKQVTRQKSDATLSRYIPESGGAMTETIREIVEKHMRPFKNPYRVPWRNTISYLVAPREGPITTLGIFILSLLLTVMLAWGITQILSASTTFRNPDFIGLFGAVFGAFLGSAIGGYTTLQSQRLQFQAQTAIAKKQNIYIPLYDDLLQFRQHLQTRPYPIYFTYGKAEANSVYTPRFGEWPTIKSESRYLQVPTWIARALNQYHEELLEYSQLWDIALHDSRTRTADIALRDYKITLPQYSEQTSIRAYLQSEFSDFRDNVISPFDDTPFTDNQLWDFWTTAKAEVLSLESVVTLARHYQESVVEHLDWIIQALAETIRYIASRYEKQDDDV